MKNKRWIFAFAVILVMAVSTLSFAVGGFRGMMRGGPSGEFIKEKVLSRMDYTMQELHLTSQQQAQYASIRSRMAQSLTESFKKHQAARKAMKGELSGPAPDVRALAKQLKAEVGTIPDRINSQIDSMLEIYDILTPDQQKKFAQMLKERMDRKRPGPGFSPSF